MTLLAALAVAAGALVQGITGIGFSLVSAPFLIALLGAHDGVRISLVLSGGLNVLLLVTEHRRIRLTQAGLLFVPAAIATPIVALAVKGASPRPLAIGGGVLTIVAAIAVARGRFQNLRGRGGVVVAGAVSGAMNVTAAIGGPAAAIYAVSAGWPPEDTRATLQAYFLALNVVGALTLGIIVPGLSLVIAMAAGLGAGFLLRRHVSTAAARQATLALAVAGGLAAIYRGLH